MEFLYEITFFHSLEMFVNISIIIFISQFIYSAVGFGSGMFAISLLALIYKDISLFVPFFVLICLPTEMIVSYKDRDVIDLRHNWKFLIFIFPAIILGSFFLKQSNRTLLIALGALIVALSVYYLFFEHKIHLNLKSRAWFVIFGSISGFLGGLFAMAAPPLIFYFKSVKLPKREFRVALLSIFLAMTAMRLTIYLFMGNYTREIFYSSVFMLPLSFLGYKLGEIFHHRISEEFFKRVASIVLFVCGFLIVLRYGLSKY